MAKATAPVLVPAPLAFTLYKLYPWRVIHSEENQEQSSLLLFKCVLSPGNSNSHKPEENRMISSRRLTQMAKKWLQRAAAAAAAGRKRIAFNGGGTAMAPESVVCTSTAPARKGCFAVYSNDGQRFEVPLAYLKSDVFAELLRMSEGVFGLPGAGPITLPCDAAITDSVISCLRRSSSEEAGRALLASMAVRQCSTYINSCSLTNQQLVVCSC